jgi:antitoxin (DNA-binding transcriptional repressor) of toxin-antitoxin stability system
MPEMEPMTQVTLEEAQARLPDLVAAAVRGEEIVIEQANHAAVRLTPVQTHKPQPRFGSAKGLLTVPDDFDAPLDHRSIRPPDNCSGNRRTDSGYRR